jgi:hypothetical protein
MAKAKSAFDLYPQFALVVPAEAVAGDGVTVQVPTTYSLKDKVGLVILSVDYMVPQEVHNLLVANDDEILLGVHQLENRRPELGGMNHFGNGIIDIYYLKGTVGAAGYPVHHDYSVQGGILVHPSALFVTAQGASIADVVTAEVRINYKLVELSDSDYQDIFQTIITQNAI